jgi:hypothetical protein
MDFETLNKMIVEACDLHGAETIYRAAEAWLAGEQRKLAEVGLSGVTHGGQVRHIANVALSWSLQE